MVMQIHLFDSAFQNHTLVLWNDTNDGLATGCRAVRNDEVEREISKHPLAQVFDRRTDFDPDKLRAESYSKVGTLRRGGFSVI